MRDVAESLERALINQGWLLGKKGSGIGHPFEWVDGDHTPGLDSVSGTVAVLQYLSHFYESYATPEVLRTADHDQVLAETRSELEGLLRRLSPFPSVVERFSPYLAATALVRTQDYCAIRTLCPDLPAAPVHVDIGPGQGTQAIYSLRHLGGSYAGLEADPLSYEVQRLVYRSLATEPNDYLDVVVGESLGLSTEQLAASIADHRTYRLRHIPSWYYGAVPGESVDLVGAAWVLNEVAPSGIIWLLGQSTRALKTGGYLYIRDSGRLKPNRHTLDYDAAMGALGYEAMPVLGLRNRVDLLGVPRAYRKVSRRDLDFDSLFDELFDRFAVSG